MPTRCVRRIVRGVCGGTYDWVEALGKQTLAWLVSVAVGIAIKPVAWPNKATPDIADVICEGRSNHDVSPLCPCSLFFVKKGGHDG